MRVNHRGRVAIAILGVVLCARDVTYGISSSWLNAVDGNWTDSAKWSTGIYPNDVSGSSYDAFINAIGASYNLTLQSNITTDHVTLNSSQLTFNQTGGIFRPGVLDIQAGTYRFISGTIAQSRIQGPGTITMLNQTGTVGILDGCTTAINMAVDFSNPLSVRNGLTLDGNTISLTASSSAGNVLRCEGVQTIGGNGQIVFDGTQVARISAEDRGGSGLTIGSGVTVRTGNGSGNLGEFNIPSPIINAGTLAAETAKSLQVYGSSFVNTGQIRIGSTGSVYIYAPSTTAGLGTFVRAAGSNLYLGSVIDNTGAVLDSGNLGGDTWLHNCTIKGGTLRSTAGKFMITVSNGINLDGVTVDAALNLGSSELIRVQNSLSLNNKPFTTQGADINFQGTCLLGGTGTIAVDGLANSGGYSTTFSTENLTIASGITIQTGVLPTPNGSGGIVLGSASGTFDNQGTITSQTAGMPVRLTGTHWVNHGTINLSNGSLYLDGVFTTDAIGTINRTGGTLLLEGTLENASQTLALNNTTGSWQLSKYGKITGGTVSTTGTAKLNVLDSTAVTLDSVVLNGSANVSAGETLILAGTHTLNGSILLSGSNSSGTQSQVQFTGALLNSTSAADVIFNANAGNWLELAIGSASKTISSGVTIRTGTGGGLISYSGTVLNQGTISAQTSGQTIKISGTGTLQNAGLIEAKPGTTLTTSGTWTNTGNIQITGAVLNYGATVTGSGGFIVNNSRINLARSFTAAEVAALPLVSSSNTLGLISNGVINATSTPFDLNSATGSLNITGGSLKGGRFTAATGYSYQFATPASSPALTMDGITLAASIAEPHGVNIVTQNGLTIDSVDISMTNTLATTWTSLYASGTQTWGGNGTITFNGTQASNNISPYVSGTLTLGSGLTIRTGVSGGTIGDRLTSLLSLISNSKISARTSGKGITIAGKDFTNAGTLEATGGGAVSINSSTNFTNLASNTLTGGTYRVDNASTLSFGGKTFTTNAADVSLNGVTSVFGAIAPINQNAGSFSIDSGRNFATVGALANSGTLYVGTNCTFSVNGPLNNTGTIKGYGTIVGNVISNGTISPGASAGTLTVNGNLTLSSLNNIKIELGGTNAGVNYDVLNVKGALALGGTLEIAFINGFQPSASDVFTPLKFTSVSGTFANVIIPTLPPGVVWDGAAIAAGSPIVSIPEPSGVAILGLLAAAKLRRRRSCKAASLSIQTY